jgi:hypothetical protein
MKVAAVQCDARGCPHIEVPTDGADLPYNWLLVDIYQEGDGNVVSGAVYCSWACLNARTSYALTPDAPVRRKRRTRAQIEADAAAAAEFEATERSLGVPPA